MHELETKHHCALLYRTSGKLILSSILVWCMVYPLVSYAHKCGSRNWKYQQRDLEEARRRLNSDAIETLSTRVSCANAIINAPGLSPPLRGCADCAVEYAGLLADAAVHLRSAAMEADSNSTSQILYLKREVEVRQKLHQFLSNPDQKQIKDSYFQSNLLALADTMERTGEANEYHQLISQLSETERFDVQIYRVWIKAVRSCAMWNFKSVESKEVLRTSLCNQNCIDDLKAVYFGLQKADLLQTNGNVKTSLPSMPIPTECD